eukprot:3273193-Rhodomonas_salina.1
MLASGSAARSHPQALHRWHVASGALQCELLRAESAGHSSTRLLHQITPSRCTRLLLAGAPDSS